MEKNPTVVGKNYDGYGKFLRRNYTYTISKNYTYLSSACRSLNSKDTLNLV